MDLQNWPLEGGSVVLASYLIFARWPSTRAAVLYDGDCAFCERTKQFFERFDLEKQFEWIPFQSNRANSFGIDPDRLRQLVDGGFLNLKNNELSSTAAGRQRLNAVLGQLLI